MTRHKLDDDADLLIELLAQQRALKIQMAELTCTEIAAKFDVCMQRVYVFRQRHRDAIYKRAREIVGR